jgi:curved DNA-binding protein CbpA
MADYYSILGLQKTANDIEIKTAFRKLAKIYHPDKNPNDPNAKNIFENILRAYNTLINPHQRRRYDLSLSAKTQISNNYQRHPSQQKKDWSFTEEELKKRQYYKNYYQAKKQTVKSDFSQKKHTDYKYILFATPIAVLLLMLILSLFSSEPKISQTNNSSNRISLDNGDQPYRDFFGTAKAYNNTLTFKINNSTNYDAIVLLYDLENQTYIEHSYLKSAYSAEFTSLPKNGIYWKCVLGKNWQQDKINLEGNTFGLFDSIVQYQNWQELPVAVNQNNFETIYQISYLEPKSAYNKYISTESDFFKR